MTRETARSIVLALVADLQGRAGLGSEWDGIDEAVKAEIVEEWTTIAQNLGCTPDTGRGLASSLRRGVDFPCEKCHGLHGSTLWDGWFRCNGCGYPGK